MNSHPGQIEIITFGYLHGEPPAANITLDLRHHFRDPHVDPELREMTAVSTSVLTGVLVTDGIMSLIEATALAVRAFQSGPNPGKVVVAVGCAGGRHRAPAFGMFLAAELRLDPDEVQHRDLSKPVVNRDSKVSTS